jgi:hypothetical protein
VFGLVLAAPFYYAINHMDEFRMPMVGLLLSTVPACFCFLVCVVALQVPPQYPPDVHDVLVLRRNSMLKFDYSKPDYELVKKRAEIYWMPVY